jgi:phenylalanyl-tRNA synthetase beta chain
MKLPIAWLLDYLPENLRGEALAPVLAAACERWELEPATDPAQTLARLMTFAGFNCDGVDGRGLMASLELDVLSNRPDGQSLLGLAREVTAILGVELKLPRFDLEGVEGTEAAAQLASVEVHEPELCPRYTARIIRGVKVGPSPKWLQDRLTWMGLQPRNNIVDVTNFICFELNQPLHAFDLKTLDGRKIVVRRATEKEPLTPLYGEIPALTPETLVIADGKQARAVAGVLGGKGSEVTPETTDILLEAAYFHPGNTRRTVRRLKVMDGRGTDSSYRFERGIDLDAVDRASARAARLIVEVAGGKVASGLIDVYMNPRAPKSLDLRFAEVRRVFGAEIPVAEVRRTLVAVGCEIKSENAEKLAVAIPSWRRGDLEREIDLVEEVARLYGFNRVPETTAMSARVPHRTPREIAAEGLRTLLTSLGYFEAISDSLVDPRWPAPAVWTKDAPLALDPQSVLREDHSAMRNSLLASLLDIRRHNQNQRTGEARLFEIGKVFLKADRHSIAHGTILDERPVLALLDDRGFHALADALQRFGAALEWSGAHLRLSAPTGETPEFLKSGEACRVIRVREMKGDERAENAIGWMGTLSAPLQSAFGLRNAPAVCELDLEMLASLPSEAARYRDLPKFPEIVRDIAMVVDESVTWGEIESFAAVWAMHDPLRDRREAPRFLSVFRSKQIGAGKKSIAFSLVYRAADRTLTDDEVNPAHAKFQAELLAKFHATLRT